MVYGCYNIVKCIEHLIFDVFLPKIDVIFLISDTSATDQKISKYEKRLKFQQV